MHCGNSTFIYHEKFNKYMKVEGATLEDVFHYLFDIEVRKFLLEKENKYLHELFEKWDPEHLQIEEEFNDGLENNVKDEDIQNLNVDE